MRASTVFDLGESLQNREILLKYAYRRDVSKKWTCFDLKKLGGCIDYQTRQAQQYNRKHCLEMFKTLIIGKSA